MEHTSRFFDFFPPPRFLAMPSVGLVISNNSIRFAELERKGDHFVLSRYGEEKLPHGVISSGVVQDSESLRVLLLRMRKEHNLTFVRLALPEQQSYLITLLLPHMRKSKTRDSIELQLDEHVPINPQEAVFDYGVSACFDTKEKDSMDVGVSVISQDIAENYVLLLRGAGLIPLSFETEAQATARALIRSGDCGTYMIVDVGRARTGLYVVSRGIVRFTWTIAIGGDTLTRAVVNAFHVSPEDARERKNKEGLTRSKNKEGLLPVLMPALETLRDEISKRYVYWHTYADEGGGTEKEKIEKILLCGGEANIPGLLNYLAGALKKRVELANPWINIASFDEYIPEIHHRDSLRYATALGLAQRMPQ